MQFSQHTERWQIPASGMTLLTNQGTNTHLRCGRGTIVPAPAQVHTESRVRKGNPQTRAARQEHCHRRPLPWCLRNENNTIRSCPKRQYTHICEWGCRMGKTSTNSAVQPPRSRQLEPLICFPISIADQPYLIQAVAPKGTITTALHSFSLMAPGSGGHHHNQSVP